MTTIDKLDMSVYNLYALRTTMIEQIEQQLQLKSASAIPTHTQIVDIFPKLTEIDLLLGIIPLHTPWAYFYPPRHFRFIRRSPFARHRVAPSFGSLEQQAAMEGILESIACSDKEEENEKEALKNCFGMMSTINKWMGDILGNIGRFVQG